MSCLRESTNYIWCTTSVLGKGATSAVFQGVSKHDGEPVAVKTFNRLSHMRPQEVQLREFEILKKVRHENIVKLLAIEEEQYGRGKVIVMELCTGGSLCNLLDDPENTYGLCEDDFLLVLSHLSAGMKHLSDNNIVHRDLKPGNIMKIIAEDGQVVFKLIDFGAARELEENQEFSSLYGTEEYLHPDMYERAVLRKRIPTMGKKTFSASVDLWSIGVTLYHVATGFLPFRPYGGRKNKEMMHFITTKKESGVISGCQHTENGQIEWKRELPTSCDISGGLKTLITPLLAGLMEVDERKRWTYDVFFNGVSKIMAKQRVHLFYLNKIQTHRIYIDPGPSCGPVSSVRYSSPGGATKLAIFANFQKLIFEQTEIPPENQILLHKEGTIQINTNNLNNCSCGSSISSGSYLNAPHISQVVLPLTTEVNPLILCDRENINVNFDWDVKDLPKFSIFPDLVNVENDAMLAKLSCAVGYAYKRKIEKITRNVHLIYVAVEKIVSVIGGELTIVAKDSCAKIQSRVHAVAQIFGLMRQIQRTLMSYAQGQTNPLKSERENTSPDSSNSNYISSNSFSDLDDLLISRLNGMGKSTDVEAGQFRQLTQRLESLEQPINQLYSRFVQNGSLMLEWRKRSQYINVNQESGGQGSLNPKNSPSTSSVSVSMAAGSISRAGKKAGIHVGKLRESWQHLLRDRATRSLTYNDKQFHILERIKMQAKSKCLSQLLNQECQLVIVGLTEVLSDWYKQALAALIQTDILANNMTILERNVHDFFEGMDDRLDSFRGNLEFVSLALKDRQELMAKQQQMKRQQQQLRQQQQKEKPQVQYNAVPVKVKKRLSTGQIASRGNILGNVPGNVSSNRSSSSHLSPGGGRNQSRLNKEEFESDSVALKVDNNNMGKGNNYGRSMSSRSHSNKRPSRREQHDRTTGKEIKAMSVVQEEVSMMLKENAELRRWCRNLIRNQPDAKNMNIDSDSNADFF